MQFCPQLSSQSSPTFSIAAPHVAGMGWTRDWSVYSRNWWSLFQNILIEMMYSYSRVGEIFFDPNIQLDLTYVCIFIVKKLSYKQNLSPWLNLQDSTKFYSHTLFMHPSCLLKQQLKQITNEKLLIFWPTNEWRSKYHE